MVTFVDPLDRRVAWARAVSASLVDLLRRNIDRDLGDAPAVYVEVDCFVQDLEWMPTAGEVRPVVPPER